MHNQLKKISKFCNETSLGGNEKILPLDKPSAKCFCKCLPNFHFIPIISCKQQQINKHNKNTKKLYKELEAIKQN